MPENLSGNNSLGRKGEFESDDIRDAAQALKNRVRKEGGASTETIPIRVNGSLNLAVERGKDVRSLFVSLASNSGSGDFETLLRFAQKVNEHSPELIFSFDKDPAGKFVKYTVTIKE